MEIQNITIHRGSLQPLRAGLIAIHEGGILVNIYADTWNKAAKRYIPNHHFDYIEWVSE